MISILAGNTRPIEVHQPLEPGVYHPHAQGDVVANWNGRGEHRVRELDPFDNSLTSFLYPRDVSFERVLADFRHAWPYHSADRPGWVTVQSDDQDLAALVRSILVREYDIPDVAPGEIVNLVTNAGLDFIAQQLGGTPATTPAVYVGLTNNSTAPAAGDTTLTGEYSTTGGGLLRKQATYAHTSGATTYTLTVTFTANASDTLPFTANKCGIFTASSGGTMVFEGLISPALTWNGSGDQGTITETVTI